MQFINFSAHIHMIICRVHLDQYNAGSNFLATHSLIPLHCPPQFKSIKSIILWLLCTTVPGHLCRSPSPMPQHSLISVDTSQVLMNAPICIMHVHYNTLLHSPSLPYHLKSIRNVNAKRNQNDFHNVQTANPEKAQNKSKSSLLLSPVTSSQLLSLPLFCRNENRINWSGVKT